MQKKKILFILALLCAVVQGAKADDTYAYPTKTKPEFYASYGGKSNVVVINTAAELAYITEHFDENSEFPVEDDDWSELNYYLNADIDMGREYSWLPLGRESNTVTKYEGTFWGNGHTITYMIRGLDEENQGLFATIHEDGKVYDVNVVCDIYTKRDFVGGIAGENYGLIENCTVTANIESNHDDVGGIVGHNLETGTVKGCHVTGLVKGTGSAIRIGGIAGRNNHNTDGAGHPYLGTIVNCWVEADVSSECPRSDYPARLGGICGLNFANVSYCCMTGNVSHASGNSEVGAIAGSSDRSYHDVSNCTFYGILTNNYNQKNIYVGDKGDTMKNMYDTFNQAEYDAAAGNDLYRYAVKYPYAVNIKAVGLNTVEVSAGGETGITRWHPNETVTLTRTSIPVKSVTITDADGNNVALQGHANDNSNFWFTMPKKNVTATVEYDFADWPKQGSGNENDPYIISSTEEWDFFVNNVILGRDYSEKYVKLTNDISVTTMAGAYQTDDNYQPFSGTFDGNGHTLTINLSNQSRFAAPFKCVSGATIKNLRTAGTISGTGNTAGKLLSGLVGISFGSTTITNCRSSVTLTTDFGEDAAMAGFVAGTKGGSLTISGCVFDGSMTGSTNTRCAGIAGYEYGGTTTNISDCLFAPATLTVSTTDDTFTKTFSRDDDATFTNCYYTKVLGAAQGTLAMRTATAPSGIGNEVQNYGMVMAYENGLLFGGKYYYATATSAGNFTEASPHIISSTDDWNDFVHNVGIGYNYSGKFVKLTNNINVTTKANGTFSGTFDGDGHTITANISGTEAMALFNRLNGGTIKNLTVAGGISGGQHTAALLVSLSNDGTNLVENCVVSANVTCSESHMGGFLAHGNESNITFRGCVFKGKMTGGSTAKGVFYGWGSNSASGTRSITDCLYIMADGQDTDGLDLAIAESNGTFAVSNCYKTASAGSQGTQVYSISGGTGVSVANAGVAGSTYNVSGLTFCNIGLQCGDVAYAANGSTVSLTIGSKSGYTTSGYTASAGTLSGTGNPYTLTMPGSNVTISASECSANALTPDGSGNYLINSVDDWNTFCAQIERGTNTFSGKTVKLTDDISVETMAGVWSDTQSERRVFSGTFDGDGHTLTINVSNQSRFAAPFKCVSGATIRNLHTAGTIDGTGNADGKLLAGIVGVSFGNTTISGCRSSVTLTTNFGEDAALGGLVAGTKGGSLTIEGCVFDGSMTGASNSRCAGIAGFEYEGTTTTIRNTIFAPATLTVSTTDDTYTKTFTRDGDATIDNCYYTKALGAAQGTAAIAATTAPTDLSNLVEDYGMVKAYAHGILVGGTYYGVSAGNVSLADDDDNSTTISSANGYVADVTLTGRMLYKDGAWNTICLPFDVTIAGSPLAGATARALESASISGTTLTLTFGDAVTTLKAGTPYIIKWTADANYVDDDEHNIVSPVFSGVTINATDRSYDNGESDDTQVRFLGTYKYTAFDSEDKSILFLGAANKLYYPQNGASLGAQRAYFKIGTDGGSARQITDFEIDFGDSSETTGILNSQISNLNSSDAWYTIDGRKLSGKPSVKGVYVNNGRKVIIK